MHACWGVGWSATLALGGHVCACHTFGCMHDPLPAARRVLHAVCNHTPRKLGNLTLIYTEYTPKTTIHGKNWWGSAPPLAPLHAPTAFARPALSHTASPTPIEMPRGRGRPSWGHNASHFTSSTMGSLVQPTRPLASATTARRGARHHEGHSRRVAHV